MFRLLLVFVVSMLLVSPAFAGGGGGSKGGGKKKAASNQFQANWATEEVDEPLDEGGAKRASHAVDIPMVILPVTYRGRLSNYLFLSIRLNLNESKDAWPLRAKSQFLSDAIIRFSHDQALVLDTAGTEGEQSIDMAELEEMVFAAIEPWVKQDLVSNVEFPKMNLQR